MAPRYPVFTQKSNTTLTELRKLDEFGTELEKMIGSGTASDGITAADVAKYLTTIGRETQYTKTQLESAISQTQLDNLERKLKEFQAVSISLPPSKGTSTMTVDDVNLGYIQVKNSNNETVNALVSIFNTGILDDTFELDPVNVPNDAGVLVNIDNIVTALGGSLDLHDKGHLMSAVNLKDFKLSFDVSFASDTEPTHFLMLDVEGTGDSYKHKYYDFDSHFDSSRTTLKSSETDTTILGYTAGQTSTAVVAGTTYKVEVYRQESEVSIAVLKEDGSLIGAKKTFSVNQSGNFGLFRNTNITINNLRLDDVKSVFGTGNDTAVPTGFAYNVQSSMDGNRIMFQHTPNLYVGGRLGNMEVIEFKPGSVQSILRTNSAGSMIFTAADMRFIFAQILYGSDEKYVLYDLDSSRDNKIVEDIVRFDQKIRAELTYDGKDVSIVGMYSQEHPQNAMSICLKTVVGTRGAAVVDPNNLDGENYVNPDNGEDSRSLPTHVGMITLDLVDATKQVVVDANIMLPILLPTDYFAYSDQNFSSPGGVPREPSLTIPKEQRDPLLHYNVFIGYKLLPDKSKLLKMLILYTGVLVGELDFYDYTLDGATTTTTSGEATRLDPRKFSVYVNCVTVNTTDLYLLAGAALRNGQNLRNDLNNRWGVFSSLSTPNTIATRDAYFTTPSDTWNALSTTIFNIKDDRTGLVEFQAADPTKIPNFDTYGYGQTFNDNNLVLVAPCRNSIYKSLSVYKIYPAQPPNFAIGFWGSPGYLELRCVVETHEPSGRWQAGAFNRVTVGKNYVGATDWYNGNIHMFSIDSLVDSKTPVIKAYPEDKSDHVNDFSASRVPYANDANFTASDEHYAVTNYGAAQLSQNDGFPGVGKVLSPGEVLTATQTNGLGGFYSSQNPIGHLMSNQLIYSYGLINTGAKGGTRHLFTDLGSNQIAVASMYRKKYVNPALEREPEDRESRVSIHIVESDGYITEPIEEYILGDYTDTTELLSDDNHIYTCHRNFVDNKPEFIKYNRTTKQVTVHTFDNLTLSYGRILQVIQDADNLYISFRTTNRSETEPSILGLTKVVKSTMTATEVECPTNQGTRLYYNTLELAEMGDYILYPIDGNITLFNKSDLSVHSTITVTGTTVEEQNNIKTRNFFDTDLHGKFYGLWGGNTVKIADGSVYFMNQVYPYGDYNVVTAEEYVNREATVISNTDAANKFAFIYKFNLVNGLPTLDAEYQLNVNLLRSENFAITGEGDIKKIVLNGWLGDGNETLAVVEFDLANTLAQGPNLSTNNFSATAETLYKNQYLELDGINNWTQSFNSCLGLPVNNYYIFSDAKAIMSLPVTNIDPLQVKALNLSKVVHDYVPVPVPPALTDTVVDGTPISFNIPGGYSYVTLTYTSTLSANGRALIDYVVKKISDDSVIETGYYFELNANETAYAWYTSDWGGYTSGGEKLVLNFTDNNVTIDGWLIDASAFTEKPDGWSTDVIGGSTYYYPPEPIIISIN